MNLKDISTIKLGSQDVKAIYKGSQKIWPSFLLDQFPGAAAAYSLRQLSAATTNVVRVRRSSDNTEQDFTATEVTDGTLATFTGAGDGFVTTWYDQSGNSNDTTQATAISQPKIMDTGNLVLDNGKPAIDSAGSVFLDTTLSNWLNPSNVTIFIAHNTKSINTIDGLINIGSFSDYFGQIGITNEYAIRFFGTGRTFVPLNDLSKNILSVFWNVGSASTHQFFVNGSELTGSGSATVTSPTNNLKIFNRSDTALDYPEEFFSELIIYDSDQSANRTEIEGNINSYYNIY